MANYEVGQKVEVIDLYEEDIDKHDMDIGDIYEISHIDMFGDIFIKTDEDNLYYMTNNQIRPYVDIEQVGRVLRDIGCNLSTPSITLRGSNWDCIFNASIELVEVEEYPLDYVIAELKNDNFKRFKRVDDGLVLRVLDDCLRWTPGHRPLGFDDSWVELKGEPLDFIEAFEIFVTHNKDITCYLDGKVETFYGNSELDYSFSEESIQDGIWYVEEE